jgi:SAM-dependent methyltransferase
MDPRNILAVSQVYQAFQRSGGFFGARLKSLERYLKINDGETIVDVGCGPGYLLDHLPTSCRYYGFDTDKGYIEHARAKNAPNAEFHLGIFDEEAASRVKPADVILMTGLLHHLTDEEARALLSVSMETLRPGGRLLTLDGCYRSGQSLFKKKLLDWDRGEYVRAERGYRELFPSQMALEVHIDEDLSRIPYTFISIVARRPSN